MQAPFVKELQAAVGLQATLADHLVIRATRTRDSYRRYLERALGLERGLETVLANLTFDWDVSSRSKLSLISGDLLALGASVEEILAIPTCTAMQSVPDPIEAHAWLFVVERASTAHWAAYHQLDYVVREIAASYVSSLLVRRGWDQVCEALGRFTLDDHVREQLRARTEQAMREMYTWFSAAESSDGSAPSPGRIARGSDNLRHPLDAAAGLVVPPTKRNEEPSEMAEPPHAPPTGPREEPGDGAE